MDKIKPTIYENNPVHIHEIKMFDGSIGIVKDTEELKLFKSHDYNYYFNKKSGEFIRWGKGDYTKEPPTKFSKKSIELYQIWSLFWGSEKGDFKDFLRDLETDGSVTNTVPELVDMEISEICHGVKGIGACEFCYKSNVGHKGKNTSFETFKKVFDKLPKSVTQIAFGIGDIDSNPDFKKIVEYTRMNGIIPNVTINGDRMTSEWYDWIVSVMGATAVSVYDKDISYNAVKELTDRGMDQVNIHQMISEQTFERTKEVLNDKLNDSRLSKMGSVVLLSLKLKGRSIQNNFTQLGQEKFNELFGFAIKNNMPIGFDSCSSALSINYVKDHPELSFMNDFIEPCESGAVYSSYINVSGQYNPCSFSEGEGEWKEGIDVVSCNNFMEDVWHNEKTRRFGKEVLKCRECNIGCPIFEI